MKILTGAIAATLLSTTMVLADPVDDTLILNEETTLVTRTAAPAHMADEVDEIMFTADYGESWFELESPIPGRIKGVDFNDNGECMVSYLNGEIYTANGWMDIEKQNSKFTNNEINISPNPFLCNEKENSKYYEEYHNL